MKINVITTIEIDREVDEQITQKDIEEAYEEFYKLIEEAYRTKDITGFLFVNPDTNMEIEDEVEE